MPSPFTSLLRGGIILYRAALSPWFGQECRFIPTCSAYALDALEQHGALRGSLFAIGRICRCHPWGGMGYDPVPPRTPIICERVNPSPEARKTQESSYE